jgi:NAD-dependent dihydropyrimidine dehydrogenase PreA subunit
MMPWAFGIFEFQLKRLDRELAEIVEEYMPVFGRQFFQNKPQLMQVIPIERQVALSHEALPYEKVSFIIENGASFAVNDCICKKERGLLDHPCAKPIEVCMAIAPIPGVFETGRYGRPISKAEAYQVLEKAEEAGLVHLTYNIEGGHFFICNCCGCCCGVLRAITELGVLDAVNAYYRAWIDPDLCAGCGLCRDERCQVAAIEEQEEGFRVIETRCIGCGLCVTTCPTEAISLVRKPAEEIAKPPKDEKDWFDVRGRARGVDFSRYQ